MKYAVNEPGVAALNSMAQAIEEVVEEIRSQVKTVQSVADENDNALGPHKSSLDDVIESIDAALKQANGPANHVAEILRDVAEAYEEIIANDRLKGLGK